MPHPISHDEAFHYCCLWPHTTGLPMRIWLPDDGAPDGNMRVQTTHAAASLPNQVALVSVSHQPALVAGTLSASDLAAVRAFIVTNLDALRAHRNGECDSAGLVGRLIR